MLQPNREREQNRQKQTDDAHPTAGLSFFVALCKAAAGAKIVIPTRYDLSFEPQAYGLPALILMYI